MRNKQMKIAVCVKDENLEFFSNAGHSPMFAIFEQVGGGMFKQYKHLNTINNPREDLDHDHADENHQCSHDANDQEHINEHNKMGHALQGCDYIVVQKACKNTANAFIESGIKIKKYDGISKKAQQILGEITF